MAKRDHKRNTNLDTMIETNDLRSTDNPSRVLNWYDFICPFCYVGQQRNAILDHHGFDVVELPFQAHPDIPTGGITAGPRTGSMYVMLEREAKEAGLKLKWPKHLPNTRHALAAAEWVRQHQSGAFPKFHKDLFGAHFVLGEDLDDPQIINRHANEAGVDLAALNTALLDGTAPRAVDEAEILGRSNGVRGTPAWLLDRQLISGLRPAAEFERLAKRAANNSFKVR